MLLAAQRPQQAAARLRRISLRLMFEGGVHTVVRLAEQFPPEFARSSADLQHVAGYAKWRLWRNAEADHHLQAAEVLHRAQGDEASARLAAWRRAAMLAGIGRPDAARRAMPEGGSAADGDRSAHSRPPVRHLDRARGRCQPRRGAPLRGAARTRWSRHAKPELWATMVPTPRLTACPAVGPLLARWADAVSVVEAESPLLLSALAPMTQGWRALWAGRLDEAERCLQRSERDERWVGHPPIVQSHRLAFSAVLQMGLGDDERALAAARAHGEEFPQSYGGRGPWYALFLMGRVAATCGDAPLLREALLRLSASASRACPKWHRCACSRCWVCKVIWRCRTAAPPRPRGCGSARWSTKRHATSLAWPTNCAPGWRCCGCMRVTRTPQRPGWRRCCRQSADGPRGALFALPALCELAAATWAEHLDADHLATLQAWAAPGAAAAPAAAATAAMRASPPQDPLSARETEVLSLMARGMSNKLIARELDLSPHTVKRHVAHVLDKLELASRSQAAAWFHAQARR